MRAGKADDDDEMMMMRQWSLEMMMMMRVYVMLYSVHVRDRGSSSP